MLGYLKTELSDEFLGGITAAELSRINERSLAITLDSIGDGVISTDRGGRVLRMNKVAQRLTGWSRSEAQGRHLDEVFKIIDSESGATLRGPFEAAMRSKSAVTLTPNTTLVARNGTHHLIEDSAAQIRDNPGSRSVGVVLVFRDVTEKKKLEVEFQQAKKLETIGRLAGGVAHDFNNLLAGIMGYSEILVLELQKDPRLHGYARSILDTSERAAKLISQLLAFSRRAKMQSVQVELHACISTAVSLLTASSDQSISVQPRLKAASTNIEGDPTLIESALLNLLINARDASLPGASISIESRNVSLTQDHIAASSLDIPAGEYIEIVVSDTGTGMSDEVKSHLYEPFFTTKAVGKGSGLGLASVHGTIKQHHGAISVVSTLGLGTSIRLYLPLSNPLRNRIEEEGSQVVNEKTSVPLYDENHLHKKRLIV